MRGCTENALAHPCLPPSAFYVFGDVIMVTWESKEIFEKVEMEAMVLLRDPEGGG